MGIDALAAEQLAENDPARERYPQALARVRKTGSLPYALQPRPTLPPPSGLDDRPWSIAGGEVLGWNGGAWVALEPCRRSASRCSQQRLRPARPPRSGRGGRRPHVLWWLRRVVGRRGGLTGGPRQRGGFEQDRASMVEVTSAHTGLAASRATRAR